MTSVADWRRQFFALDLAATRRNFPAEPPGHLDAQIGNGRLHVVQADPVIWVTGELLALLHAGSSHPDVTFRCALGSAPCPAGAYIGDTIRISADNGQYVYVITRKVPEHMQIWEAAWPD